MDLPPSFCNSSDLLHPHLMETSSIVEYLKHRQLAIPNIEQKSRDELLKIFHSYAMPLHKRSSTRRRDTDHEMEILTTTDQADQANKSSNKHKRIIYESNTSPGIDCSASSKSMDLVTNGCKRIKIEAFSDSTSENKRGPQDIKVDLSLSQKSKRQKITWP